MKTREITLQKVRHGMVSHSTTSQTSEGTFVAVIGLSTQDIVRIRKNIKASIRRRAEKAKLSSVT